MNIVYVEYEMPGPSRMPFSAAPSKDGHLWIPNFGIANKITRLDPKTGAMEDFLFPTFGTAAVHSAVEGPDGSVWLTSKVQQIGKWDPKTQKITEYQAAYLPGKEGIESRWIETHGSLRSSRERLVNWISLEPAGSGDRKIYGFLGRRGSHVRTRT